MLLAAQISFLLVGGLEQLTTISFLVEYLVALIGLGLTIDYSLLVVTRCRSCAASASAHFPVRVIATGLAVGILLDAFIVRTLLVPALVALMGSWNWWMRRRIERMLWIPETETTTHDPARAQARA